MTVVPKSKFRNVRLYEQTLDRLKEIRRTYPIPYCNLSISDFLEWYLNHSEGESV